MVGLYVEINRTWQRPVRFFEVKKMLDFVFILNSAALGVGLAMDAFSVSAANGLAAPDMHISKSFKIAGTFGAFQMAMPLIGWFCVHTIVEYFRIFERAIPWIALGLTALMIATVLQEKSMQREIEAAKAQLQAEKAQGLKPEPAKKGDRGPDRVRLLRAALLVLAVVLIVAGVFNGSARDVFGKAVKICTECVGLG